MAITVWIPPEMTRVFPHQRIPSRDLTPPRLYAAGGEVEAFQIGVRGHPSELNDLRAEASDLTADGGATLLRERIEILFAEYVPVHWHSPGDGSKEREGQAPGFYPDPLLPALWRGVGRAQFPDTVSLWVRIRVPSDAKAGVYRGEARIACKGGTATVPFQLEVLPFSLPERSHFLMTNWFLVGPILKFHKLEPLTDAFWKVIEIYAKNLADHRQNVVLTPLFPMAHTHNILNGRLQDQLVDITEPHPGEFQFDFANFDRWVELFFGHGFELIEGGHLAGGSRHPSAAMIRHGSEVERRAFASTQEEDYRRFLRQFLTALRGHLSERGWLERFCLHLSDEPHGDQFEAYSSLSKFVREVAPEIRLMDAMGDAEYAPFVDYPVPLESSYARFVEQSGIPRERIWTYYCCGPAGPWPNRFIDYRLLRVRIFTWLAFRYGIPGFLHWGLNHWDWHPPHYRAEEYNPYDNTTGGSLQAGDSYVLYPPRMPQESHEPVDSIRWEFIRKAMEDYEYLYRLREVASGKGRLAASAQGLLREFEEKVVPDWTTHTRDDRYFLNFRKRIAQMVAEA